LFLKIIYNFIIIPFLYIGLEVVSVFNKKLRRSVQARSGIIESLNKNRLALNPYRITVLFHCSSMGEYKQIIPIVKELYENQKDGTYNIVLSLYSPSAYEHIDKKNPWFNIITYTPFDFYFETKKFINLINPDIVLISKHDVWPNFIWELKKRDVPVYLINGLFADDTKMNKWYARPFFRSLFSSLTGILTINELHRQRFSDIYPFTEKIIVSGDTRYDAVICEACSSDDLEIFRGLKGRDKVFIAGSSWPTGEKYLIKAWSEIKNKYPDAFLVIVPHEIGADHIYKLESLCQESKFATGVLTEMTGKEKLTDLDVLIVDKIGLLTKIYRYGSIAYVGGGFSTNGIHSVLEPAVYGLPVVFGPNLDKSPEAQEMNRLNCGMIFNNEKELYSIIDSLWSDKHLYKRISEISSAFIRERSGATAKIIEVIKEKTEKPKFDKKISMTEEEFEKLMNNEK
jgi:3-deoxy-D-manno-octulosonic-acid transferase